LKVEFKPAEAFSPQVKEAVRAFAAQSNEAFIKVMGAEAPVGVVHAMTPEEIAEDTASGGGDGYMDLLPGGAIRVAMRPGVTPYRAIEIWTEEQVHALRPDLSEREVRSRCVPAIVNRVLR